MNISSVISVQEGDQEISRLVQVFLAQAKWLKAQGLRLSDRCCSLAVGSPGTSPG